MNYKFRIEMIVLDPEGEETHTKEAWEGALSSVTEEACGIVGDMERYAKAKEEKAKDLIPY